ncbi:MAG: patatin-like phospholipase family protein [Wenzhouxiangellaceae bacterium]|nr:patatin-like phospholipase family protein [Wenzhouxiangellaceae bacterium]
MAARMATKRKPINLALQGGGAHGAFTWGVLDYLLEDGRLDITAISGTSAGAMNAVALADGYTRGGAEGARAKLAEFWRAISDAARFSPIRRSLVDRLMGNWSLDGSPGFHAMDALTRLASPYQLNPLNMNPLRDILEKTIDFECVRSCDAIRLFISATNVETGRVKVFDSNEMNADMIMASACLPFMFQAVEIDGVPYWDGGYMGNPSLFPFFHGSECADVVIVQINPIERKGVPKTASEIQNRINEIAFNASLLKELRAVDFVARLIEAGRLNADDYKRVRMHRIHNQDALNPLGASSKMNSEWSFLTHLRDIGRDTAADWLSRHFDDIGRSDTANIRAMFQGRDAELTH